MPILLSLFLTFLKIGVVSFGGGYGMISLIREEVLSHGWLTEDAFLNMIAISESTPGPIAVNMATFIGSSQAGLLGAIMATLGVILPAFIIILIIASIFTNLLKLAGVKAALEGIKPAVAGLITATAITMVLSVVFGFKNIGGDFKFDLNALIIFVSVATTSILYKRFKKKALSPIILIIISAILGIILYSL